MKAVTSDIIDQVIDTLENLSDEQYEKQMEKFADAQPVIFAYLFNEENFHLLTEDEKGYLQYLALITWLAIERVNGSSEPVSEDMIGAAEEANYQLLEAGEAKKFREKLDPFFENYPQEDLLSFAEEAVLEEENEPDALVTKEGREPVFIALKTIIDVLCVQ